MASSLEQLSSSILLPLLVITLLSCFHCTLAWKRGRATWYDDSPQMSVHTGSCMFGYLGSRFGGEHNWMVAAMNDGNPDYSGSCGRCFEVRCVPGSFSDSYGSSIDRSSACISQAPVVVAITDTCPCYKPGNLYSNKRWCCNDMPHLDLGVWAFRRMADPGKGVIMMEYQPVACPSDWSSTLSSASALNADKNGPIKVQAFSGPPDSSPATSPSPFPSASPSASPRPSSPSPRQSSSSPPPSPTPPTPRQPSSPSPSPSRSPPASPSPSPQNLHGV